MGLNPCIRTYGSMLDSEYHYHKHKSEKKKYYYQSKASRLHGITFHRLP